MGEIELKAMEFLEYLVKQIVDLPEEVKIDQTIDEMGVLLTLSVNSSDMGKVVGREGNTAQAIRTLVRVWGMSRQQRINVKIVDPPGSRFIKGT